ncbi:Rap1a/Tai family immunity protein [Burkholderia cepacia]|uniref:Rap1a/Tai family immunity protein n=1 Tax=Burkholderia cepacia TaxID=292 RepID=UPI00264BA1B6|nr:Rap1a/Tai family immunity protein [Burkholderia cepacia]MDN7894506.1 Rap1a/Tai family immunity protein [Burkholderia cepacia]
MKRILMLVSCLSLSAPALALDGDELLKLIRSTNPYDMGVAQGYITGAYDAAGGITRNAFSSSEKCKIDGAWKIDQVTAIVGKYIADNPVRWNDPANDLVVDAMNGAYCPTAPMAAESRKAEAGRMVELLKYRAKYGALKP